MASSRSGAKTISLNQLIAEADFLYQQGEEDIGNYLTAYEKYASILFQFPSSSKRTIATDDLQNHCELYLLLSKYSLGIITPEELVSPIKKLKSTLQTLIKLKPELKELQAQVNLNLMNEILMPDFLSPNNRAINKLVRAQFIELFLSSENPNVCLLLEIENNDIQKKNLIKRTIADLNAVLVMYQNGLSELDEEENKRNVKLTSKLLAKIYIMLARMEREQLVEPASGLEKIQSLYDIESHYTKAFALLPTNKLAEEWHYERLALKRRILELLSNPNEVRDMKSEINNYIRRYRLDGSLQISYEIAEQTRGSVITIAPPLQPSTRTEKEEDFEDGANQVDDSETIVEITDSLPIQVGGSDLEEGFQNESGEDLEAQLEQVPSIVELPNGERKWLGREEEEVIVLAPPMHAPSLKRNRIEFETQVQYLKGPSSLPKKDATKLMPALKKSKSQSAKSRGILTLNDSVDIKDPTTTPGLHKARLFSTTALQTDRALAEATSSLSKTFLSPITWLVQRIGIKILPSHLVEILLPIINEATINIRKLIKENKANSSYFYDYCFLTLTLLERAKTIHVDALPKYNAFIAGYGAHLANIDQTKLANTDTRMMEYTKASQDKIKFFESSIEVYVKAICMHFQKNPNVRNEILTKTLNAICKSLAVVDLIEEQVPKESRSECFDKFEEAKSQLASMEVAVSRPSNS